MSRGGIVKSNVFAEKLDSDPVQICTNIVTCTAQIYRHTYEAHLKESESIDWSNTSFRDNSILTPINTILTTLFRQVYSLLPVTPSSEYAITMASRGAFDGMIFSNSNLRNIGFQYSSLAYCNFNDSILCGCDFSHADLRLSDLTNADIHYACLTGALLDGCNMTGADLRGTELPDGFCSMDQNEQVEHLKSLNIPELII